MLRNREYPHGWTRLGNGSGYSPIYYIFFVRDRTHDYGAIHDGTRSRGLGTRSPGKEYTAPRYFPTVQRMENSLDELNSRLSMIGRKRAFGDCRGRLEK